MYNVVEHEGIRELLPYPSNRFYNESAPWEEHVAAIQNLRMELVNYKSVMLYCVQGSGSSSLPKPFVSQDSPG